MNSPNRFIQRMIVFIVLNLILGFFLISSLTDAFLTNPIINGLIFIPIINGLRYIFKEYEYEESEDIKVIIACAGGAASLPSMVSSLTPCIPVIGVPIPNGTLGGQDALYSIIQVPEGVPVLTMGIGRSKNAAISALQILGRKDILKQLEMENREKVKRQRNEDVPEFLRNLRK